MFRFADIGRQWVPVKLPQGSEHVQVQFLFELITRDELKAHDRRQLQYTGAGLVSRAAEIKTVDELLAVFDETMGVAEADRDEILERTHDWRGVTTPEGEELGFTRERLAALLRYDYLFQPIRQALYRASREGVAKNSEPGAAGSPAVPQA